MRTARIVAFTLTAICLVFAGYSLLAPTTVTFCAGGDCTTWDCGSSAFPETPVDIQQSGAESNCVGATSASSALAGVALAGVGLVAIALTSRRIDAEVAPAPPPFVPSSRTPAM